MITKVVHGWRVGGLIAYLMGPGRAQEHVRPRVIATWDGRDAAWQPARTSTGKHELGPLIRAVRAPAVAAGLSEAEVEADGKRGYVWHCSARVAASDRVLSDTEWADIARELLDGAGVADRGDPGGPRWVAIRHADDHIHIAVVLVRQDTCRRFWPSHDFPRLREAARRIERRLGLTVTAAADGTAAPAPGRGETEKAGRRGRGPSRLVLARLVRAAAVASGNVDEFVAALRGAGVQVELRRAPSGDLLGYKVARADDVDGSGAPVFYSGSKLAPDLSLPRLMQSWHDADSGSDAADPIASGRRRLDGARHAVAAARRGQLGEDPEGIAHATRDVLGAVGPWSPELREAAQTFDRAARPPRGVVAQPGPSSASLRRIARQLLRRSARRDGHENPGSTVALVAALVAVVREIAVWQAELGRTHQSAAAQATADAAERWMSRQPVARTALQPTPGLVVTTPEPRRGRSPRRGSSPPRG